jgi:hypothetical protein
LRYLKNTAIIVGFGADLQVCVLANGVPFSFINISPAQSQVGMEKK